MFLALARTTGPPPARGSTDGVPDPDGDSLLASTLSGLDDQDVRVGFDNRRADDRGTSARIRVAVLDKRTGAPVVGAEINAYDGVQGRTTETDGHGNASVFCRSSGTVRITVTSAGYKRHEVSASPGSKIAVDLSPRPHYIRGGVLINGTPQRVHGSLSWRTAAEEGVVPIEYGQFDYEVSPGPIELVASIPYLDSPPEQRQASLVVGEEGVVARHDFHISMPIVAIEGVVRYDDGAPAEGVRVRARCDLENPMDGVGDASRLSFRTRSTLGGLFSIDVTDTGLPYQIHAESAYLPGTIQECLPGQVVDLVVHRAARVVFRAIDDRDDEPLERDWCSLLWKRTGTDHYVDALVENRAPDANGWIGTTLPAGRVDLLLRPRRTTGLCSVRLYDVGVLSSKLNRFDFRLVEGVRLHLQVDQVSEFPEPRLIVVRSTADPKLKRIASFDAEGNVVLGRLPRGEYQLGAYPNKVILSPRFVYADGEHDEPVRLEWSLKQAGPDIVETRE